MATALGKIQLRHRTAIANNPSYDVSANVILDTLVSGATAPGDLGIDGDVMVRDSTQTDGWGWQTVAGLITPVGVPEGGTGLTSVTAGDLLYGAGASALVPFATPAAGQVLVSGTVPAWSATPTLTSLTATGAVIAGTQVQIAGSGALNFLTSSLLSAPTDGIFTMTNAAGTGFTALQFGGTSSSFPALKRSGTGFLVRLADDSGPSDISAQNFISSSSVEVGSSVAGTGAIRLGTGLSGGIYVKQGVSGGDSSLIAGDPASNGVIIDGTGGGTTFGANVTVSNNRGIFWINAAGNASPQCLLLDNNNLLTVGGLGNSSQQNGLLLATGTGVFRFEHQTSATPVIQFGGQTSSFPAFKRSSATVMIRLADDSAYAEMDALGYSAGGTAGISASITTAALVGKTITVVNGIITAFA